MRLYSRALSVLDHGFNPRICKRCDSFVATFQKSDIVSIHASVKDATMIRIFAVENISFNPRICKRCDSSDNAIKMSGLVSIHASVKDATQEAEM